MRPRLPEAEKFRTIPLRMPRPQYRALVTFMRISGIQIQEHLRRALEEYIRTYREKLEADGVPVPSELVLGMMDEDDFDNWLQARPELKQPEAKPAQPQQSRRAGGFQSRPAA